MIDEIHIEKINEVSLRFLGGLDSCLELKSFSSHFAPNYKFHPKFRNRIWNGKISWFDNKTKTFPIGLLPEVYEFGKRYGYKIVLDFDVSSIVPAGVPDEKIAKFIDIVFEGKNIRPRDYQTKAISAILNNGRGVVQSPTASGKSIIIYTAIRYLAAKGKKVLLVVPNTSLVEQMFSDFTEYGWDEIRNYVEILYSGEKPTFGKQVLISTFQSLMRKDPEFFEKYDAVFFDECHMSKSVEIQKIAKKCSNANFRIGLTGTMPTEPADVFNIKGAIGPIIYKLMSKELIDEGYLAKIQVVNCLLKYPEDVKKKGQNRSYPEESRYIQELPCRMKAFDRVFEKINDGENIIILVNHIEHLKAIESYLTDKLPDKYSVYTIYGDVDTEKREVIRHTMNNESNAVLIGTYGCVSTGINIRKVHNIILAFSSKSEIRVLQSIGRGLRTHEEKSKVIIWDLIDDFTRKTRSGEIKGNYFFLHWIHRLNYYKKQKFPICKMEIDLSK